MKKPQTQQLSCLAKASGIKKILFCVAISLCTFAIISLFKMELANKVIISWDAFSLTLIALCWTLFFTTTADNLESVVIRQDDGHKVIFLLVLIAVSFSVFGALALMTQKNYTAFSRILQIIISLSPIFFSWFLLHSIFTIRYAHLYHNSDNLKPSNDKGGIDFPESNPPDYIDFAYFSFTIGMTFQVSDATISSKLIRRYVLMHGLISFIFNTIIVALSINTISNLTG